MVPLEVLLAERGTARVRRKVRDEREQDLVTGQVEKGRLPQGRRLGRVGPDCQYGFFSSQETQVHRIGPFQIPEVLEL